MKFCRSCEQSKELDAFGKDKSRPDGKALQCKDCTNKRMRSYKDPDYARRRYGSYTRKRDGKVQEVEYSRRNHGMSKTPLYRQWKAMRGRCEDEKQHNYRWYGARGVKVCDEWTDFVVFHAWAMANGYVRGLELDRRDSDGNYCPSNCRWRTKKANIRDRDLYWSDELDARLVAYAAEVGCNPYDVITQALEKFLSDT